MYLMTCTRPDLAYPLSILARYVAPGRHRPEHMAAAKRVLRYLCSTSGMGLVLGGRRLVVLTGHADASWADDQATQRSSQGYTFSLGSGSVSWRATRSSSVLGSSCEAEIYAGAMAAQELRWLTYLLTDLGEPPRSPPVLYVDNKAMLALCREQRLEHRTKHIALRYFLARELQQRGQLRLAYVAYEANTADVFTKALAPCDHQRFCTQLGLLALLDLSCDHLLSPTLPMGRALNLSMVPSAFVFTRKTHFPVSTVLFRATPIGTTFQSLLNCGRLLRNLRAVDRGDESEYLEATLCVAGESCVRGISCFVTCFWVRYEVGPYAFCFVGVDLCGCYVTIVGEVVKYVGVGTFARIFVIHWDIDGAVRKRSGIIRGFIHVLLVPVSFVCCRGEGSVTTEATCGVPILFQVGKIRRKGESFVENDITCCYCFFGVDVENLPRVVISFDAQV
ncbi:unnamed protein product [Closterium sp. NIES-53]